MIFNRLHITPYLGALIILLALFACNSKGYQNLTAKYNGHFYAKLRLEEVNQALEEANEYNYNDILKIYPDIDSAVINGNEDKLDDAFKKASQLVDWHSASDYVDDGYLIVGKIRHLRGQFQLAIETLQYVNQTSDEPDTKHAALVTLMRTYMDMGDIDKAEQVATILSAEELSDENMADYRLTMAYFHQRQNNLRGIAQNLNEVSDIIKNKDEKSRSKFILGQIYQKLGFNEEAYEFYKASLAGTPPYELTFFAKLNMQQVADYNDGSSLEKIRKYYQTLLKDGKNTEYKGNIYYEMGEFERKQSNFDLALDNYLLSVAVENPQPRQQGLSFLRAGQLYYDQYQKFELAKAYYDSTVAVLPQDELGYEAIKDRQGVLTEFVTQINIIQKNDSLLSLSEMNSVSLDAYVEKYLVDQEKKAKEKAKKESATVATTGIDRIDNSSPSGANDNSGGWYFYNTNALSQGELEFQRVWGNRPLEDNWRRSTKDRELNDPEGEIGDIAGLENTEKIGIIAPSEERNAEKTRLLASVPQSASEKEQLHLQMQDAYYKLGDVYRFGLAQLDKAIGSYETLVDRYPEAELRPQALFALYTIFRESDPNRSESYKSQIITEYPETLMAKTLVNPNYSLDKKIRNERLQRIYAGAYEQFESGNYREAEAALNAAFTSIEDVDFLPNAQLLLAIMKAKTENLFSYEQALKDFMVTYPEGELHDYAKRLVEGIDPVKSTIIRRDDFEYSEDFEQRHVISILYKGDTAVSNQLKKDIEGYNSFMHPEKKLTIGVLEFDKDETQYILFLNLFNTKELALEYHKELQKAIGGFNSLKGKEFDNFVMSRDNFQMLFQSKEVETYRAFYERFYR